MTHDYGPRERIPISAVLSRRETQHLLEESSVADPVGLQRIGFALSGVVAIVLAVAALTVSASMGVL
jgi:hypothetical protein